MINQNAWERGSSRSAIRELFALGQKLAREQGEEAVMDFSLGNPATPPPAAVRETLTRLTQEEDPVRLHGYSSAEGLIEVREAIAASLNRRLSAGVTARDLFLTAGAAPALTAVFAALTYEAGDEIIAIAPYFPEYKVFAEIYGATLRVVPADEENFHIDFTALEALLSPRTRAVIINSPNNPSGVVYPRGTLERLAEILSAHSARIGSPVYIVSDEPYRELVYRGAEVPYLPHIYPDTVVCYSYSKSLSLPGERIGYVLIPPQAADHDALYAAVAGAARSLGHVCAPVLFQRLVGECTEAVPALDFYDDNRRLLYEGLTAQGYTCVMPEGAFYLLVRAPEGDGGAFSRRAAARGVLVVPGDSFGIPCHVRVAYCVARETILRALPIFAELIHG